MRVCIVIPMYNEEQVAFHSLATIAPYVAGLRGTTTIVVVEDGSSDQTKEEIERFLASGQPGDVRLLAHGKNRGYGAALRTGIQFATEQGYDYALFMDSDLTNHPRYLKDFWEKMEAGCDYIKATRYSKGGQTIGVPLGRRLISWIGNCIARPAFRLPIHDFTNGFRAVRVDVLKRIQLHERGFPIIVEELWQAKRYAHSFCEVPYTLTIRSASGRTSSFTYGWSTYAAYLRYVWRALWTRRARMQMLPCAVCAASTRLLFNSNAFSYVRCRRCGHVTTLPYPTDAERTQHYARGFEKENYSVVRMHEGVYRNAMDCLVAVLARWLNAHGQRLEGSHVLDIGCFTGTFLDLIRGRGAQIAGVELQPDAVQIANHRFGDAVVVAGDILDPGLTFPHERYDVVSALGLIEHVTDPLALLQRIHALLPPGGILFLQTPNAGSLPARILRGWWAPFTPIEHIHLFSQESLRRALEQSGFTVRAVSSHVKWLSIEYVYKMSSTFAPRAHRWLAGLYVVLPRSLRAVVLPWYIGEMIVIAERV